MTETHFAHGVLPDAVIRDPSAQATFIFIRLRPDLDPTAAQTWLGQLDALIARLEAPVGDRQLATVTVGFGPTFFASAGQPRFGGAGAAPFCFADLPAAPGTAIQADLVIYLMSRSPSATSDFLRGLSAIRASIASVEVERGFQRTDARELFGFLDGLRNVAAADRPAVVFVNLDDAPQEPAWTEDGTYLAFLRIRQELDRFGALAEPERERRMGRRLEDGSRVDLPKAALPDDEPEYSGAVPEPAAHVRKAGPRGAAGATKIFRRGVPFLEMQPDGAIVGGMHFASFQASLDTFNTVLNSWMLNPEFPASAGQDHLFADGFAVIERFGFFFVPPYDERGLGAPIFDPAEPRPRESGRLIVRKVMVDPTGARVRADLGGIGFQVFDMKGVSVGPVFETHSNGHAESPDLPRGRPLTLREVKPPTGVTPSPDLTFTLTERRLFKEIVNSKPQPGPYGGR